MPAASPWLHGRPESVPSNVIQGWQPVACHTHATSRRGRYRLHTIFLFQLYPKVGKNHILSKVFCNGFIATQTPDTGAMSLTGYPHTALHRRTGESPRASMTPRVPRKHTGTLARTGAGRRSCRRASAGSHATAPDAWGGPSL